MRESRNKSILKSTRIYLILTALILLCGCVGMVEKTGKTLDGSSEKTISLYRARSSNSVPSEIDVEIVESKDNKQSVIITVKEFPMVKLRGALPQNNGIFYFTSLEYLAGNARGWNEFSQDLYGTGRLILREPASLEIIEAPEQIRITKGRIHRFDTRITGAEALTALSSRYERITTLVEWMQSAGGKKGRTIKDFENTWKPVLFPETVFNNSRPASWHQSADIFITAGDVNWNTSYTKRTFPQELAPVRDSGTLLRDWEEALSLIYLEYEWDYFLSLFSRKLNLNKIK